jgi:hypothetical protein
MIKFCSYLYHYVRLIYSVNNYIDQYRVTGKHDIFLIDNIIYRIKSCGAVAIKFTQWVCPKLEVMLLQEEHIMNNEKPLWLLKLEGFYENCDDHSIQYTVDHYKEIFKNDFIDDYEILDIIGSGSIGQVYLIQDKPLTVHSETQKYVMKILHPNVNYEISFFRKFYKIMSWLPCFRRVLRERFPFDINNFIDQFNEQSDFINESNHLLQFGEHYKNNDFIIIPELIKTSASIMIMSYEEGESFDDLDIDQYQKYKVASLLVSFTKNNQHILNYHHGDLHKGNWKVMNDEGDYKLVIYDFGFCWKVPNHKTDMINQLTKIFEENDDTPESINMEDILDVLMYFLIYNIDSQLIIRDKISIYLEENRAEIKPWILNPTRLFKLIVDICVYESLLIDPILIQSIIILIQCQKILEEFRMMGTDKEEIESYEVFRSKYLDFIALYKTYDIFSELSGFLSEILTEKQIKINNLFDCIEMPESIRLLALN